MSKYNKLIENFERKFDFYNDLAMRESSGKSNMEEKKHGNYLGLYQMGKLALIDAGYFQRVENQENNPSYDERWGGVWKGKYGISSKKDFLHNPQVQEIAIREYHQKVSNYIKGVKHYQGQEVAGIKLTEGGMIAASHLVGHVNLKKFIESGGKIDAEDGNGVPCSDYLKFFEDERYNNLDMNTQQRVKEYIDNYSATEEERIKQKFALEDDFFDFLKVSDVDQKKAEKDAEDIVNHARETQSNSNRAELDNDLQDIFGISAERAKIAQDDAHDFFASMIGGFQANNANQGGGVSSLMNSIMHQSARNIEQHGDMFAAMGIAVPGSNVMGNVFDFMNADNSDSEDLV